MTNRINFTKATLENLPLPPTGSRATYHDTRIGGLQLRVTDRGVKTFCVYRRVRFGPPERITLGRFPDLTVEQARTRAQAINAAIAQGENPAEAVREAREEPTLKAAFDEYLNRYAIPQGRKTVGEMQASFARYLGGLAGKRLSQIPHAEVQKLVNTLGKTRGHATANRTLELLRAVINKAIAWKLFKGENPAVGVTKFRLPSRDRFVQADELPRLFRALAETDNTLIRDFTLLSLLTGARRANVLAMRWEDISLERSEWRIPETKNGTPQTVTLTGEALAILRARRSQASPWVFPGEGRTGHLVSPKKGWKTLFDQDEEGELRRRIVEAGGTLPDFRPLDGIETRLGALRNEAQRLGLDTSRARIRDLRIHDLRRTMGSWQAKTGASLAIIGKSLNHKSVAATTVYARLDLDPVRDSMERATTAMLAAAGLKRPETERDDEQH